MLSGDAHFGGAFHAGSSSFVLGWHSKRVIRANPSGAITATLPSNPARNDQKYQGRPRFIIINDGSANISVVDQAANSIFTIQPNKWATFGLQSGGGVAWRLMLSGTVNASMNVSSYRVQSAYPYIIPPCVTPTFEPFCAENICEWLETTQLTGEGELPEVLAPFYQDVTVHAKNSNREAVRACDCVMPQTIAVRFNDGDFTKDTLHPLSGTYTLSEALFDALYNRKTLSSEAFGSEPHILTYNESVEKTSCDWHHAAYLGTYSPPSTGWMHGASGTELTVRKYVWKKEIPYGPADNPTAYTLEIRFQMEHSLDGEVKFDPETGGGVGDLQDNLNQERGLWGALFTLAIFTDELNPSFVDEATAFQPYGWQAATTWKRHDPCVYGGSNQVIGSETVNTYSKRGVHPQCLAVAHLPTTFHAPIGRMKASQANNEFYLEFNAGNTGLARNLDDCLLVPCGTPWVNTVNCNDKVYPCKQSSWPNSLWGIMENVVFGYPDGGAGYFMGKAMSLGGDMKASKPMEWLCWDNNASGNGLTYLKVAKPGWDDACGELTVAKGNSGSIWICSRPHMELLKETGYDMRKAMSTCDGHPVEPYMGVGGSHTCFRTSSGDQLNKWTNEGEVLVQPQIDKYACCISIDSTTLRSYEFCTREDTYFGDWVGNGCEQGPVQCLNTAFKWTQWQMLMTQYTMMPNGNQTLRKIGWNRLQPDKSRTLRNWNYSSTDADFTATLGTFTRTATSITVASVSGTNPIRAAAKYDKYQSGGGTPWEWFGCDIQCEFKGVSTGPLGIGFLDSNQNGYGLNVVRSGSDLIMQLCRYSNYVKTVIDSYTFAGQGTNDIGAARFRIRGTDLLASYTPSGQQINTITKTDGVEWMRQSLVARVPDIDNPSNDSSSPFYPSFYTEHTASGAVFNKTSDPMIQDLVPVFVNHKGYAGNGSVRAEVVLADMVGYGLCDGTSSNYAICGTGNESAVSCNCVRWEAFSHSISVANHVGPADVVTNAIFSDCLGGDLRCDSNAPWTDGNPQYHGGPSPYRCRCNGHQCINFQYGCDNCPYPENPYIEFPLPNTTSCWDGRSNPNCVGSIPLICNGIDQYVASVTTCD